MIRVGIVGTGFGRSVHIPAFQRVEGAEVVGVASRDPQNAKAVAADTRVAVAFDHWQDMVASADIDAVTIATPPATHAPIALAAIAAGKSVLCEKPLALDAAAAGAMRDAAIAARVVHFTGFEFREINAFRLARERLQSGAAGEIRHVNVRWIVNSWANPARPWSWRADAEQGGGTLGALGAHVFDYLEWLLGPIRAVVAKLDTRVAHRPDAAGQRRVVTAEDYCDLLLELHDGTPVNVLLSMVASQGRAHAVDIHGTRSVFTITNEGSQDYGRGFALWEAKTGFTTRQMVNDSSDPTDDAEDGRIAPFARLAGGFINAVRSRDLDARPSFEDGTRAQMLIDMARRAWRERRWISTTEPGVAV